MNPDGVPDHPAILRILMSSRASSTNATSHKVKNDHFHLDD